LLLEEPNRVFVEVRGDDIIVTALGFYAAYSKPSRQPQLILRRRSDTDEICIMGKLLPSSADGRF
jgi:hypothetical protein